MNAYSRNKQKLNKGAPVLNPLASGSGTRLRKAFRHASFAYQCRCRVSFNVTEAVTSS